MSTNRSANWAVIVLVVMLLITGCRPNEEESNTSQAGAPGPQPTTPLGAMSAFIAALQAGNQAGALQLVSAGSVEYFQDFFGAVGAPGMADLANVLSNLTLANQSAYQAQFTGNVSAGGPVRNVTAVFMLDGDGNWKLVELR